VGKITILRELLIPWGSTVQAMFDDENANSGVVFLYVVKIM
jgi:hypothetical protein